MGSRNLAPHPRKRHGARSGHDHPLSFGLGTSFAPPLADKNQAAARWPLRAR
jgi:hypothetical protein